MAPKKKTKKKSATRKSASKKAAKPTKRPKKTAPKKRAARISRSSKPAIAKTGSAKSAKQKSWRQPARRPSQRFTGRASESRSLRYGDESGDLQGLSRRESADSESVEELLEEGNAFEADAVSGVEEADSQDGREVHTHEVSEDDVPEEYLDEN